jgi:anti-sigma regulatory factor (Ser/Thr protein kinase)
MMTSDSTDVRVRLRPTLEAAAAARIHVDGFERLLRPEVYENLRLVVSELVTNSVRHARLRDSDRMELRLHMEPSRIRVEVWDPGTGFVPPDEPTPTATSGWGLFLVEQLSDRWGVSREDGTLVWAEIPS